MSQTAFILQHQPVYLIPRLDFSETNFIDSGWYEINSWNQIYRLMLENISVFESLDSKLSKTLILWIDR